MHHLHRVAVVVLAAVAPSVATAQEVLARPEAVGPGIGVLVGGGISTLTREAGRDVAVEVGPDWLVRGIFGTRQLIGGELAYVGASRRLSPGVGADDGVLILRNGGEMLLRAQVPIGFGIGEMGLVEPFAAAGLGFASYNLTRGDLGDGVEGLATDDLAFAVPIGLGVTFGYYPFLAEVRGTYGPVLNGGLVAADTAALSTLSWTASVGLEF